MKIGTVKFIWDQLANEPEIKAQIKLKFHNKVGREMICVRSLQLTMKRTKMEQKTLEGMLITRDPDTNEVCAMRDFNFNFNAKKICIFSKLV